MFLDYCITSKFFILNFFWIGEKLSIETLDRRKNAGSWTIKKDFTFSLKQWRCAYLRKCAYFGCAYYEWKQSLIKVGINVGKKVGNKSRDRKFNNCSISSLSRIDFILLNLSISVPVNEDCLVSLFVLSEFPVFSLLSIKSQRETVRNYLFYCS